MVACGAVIFCLVLVVVSQIDCAQGGVQVQCYLASWSLNNNANVGFRISDIDPFGGCNVIIYAFFKIADNRLESPDGNKFRGHFQQLTDLKAKNPELKIYLSVGGWSFGKNFSTVAQSANRSIFIPSVVRDLRKWGLDGLDIDWEFPLATDKENFVGLLKDLRQAFDRDAETTKHGRLGLTAAVANKVLPGYDCTEMTSYLDTVNIMAYDYHGLWENENQTGSHASLPDVVNSVQQWVAAGISSSIVSVGIPLYARTWTLSNPSAPNQVNEVSVGPGTPGPLSREPGVLMYTEYCPALNADWKHYFDEPTQVTYAKRGNQWITFDEKKTIQDKVKWAESQHLKGVFVWHLGQDDVFGRCREGRFPLLANAAGLIGTVTPEYFTVLTTESTLSTSASVGTSMVSTGTPTALDPISTDVPVVPVSTNTRSPPTTVQVRSFGPALLSTPILLLMALCMLFLNA